MRLDGFLLDADFEQNRDALIKISQFVLEEEAEKVRDDLEEKIVETALFWGLKNDECASIDGIAEMVEKEIHLVKFPDLVLKDIVSRLLANGSIIESGENSYKLSFLKRTEFGKLVVEKKARIDRINSQFLLLLEREYGKRLNDEQKNEGLERLYSLLASLALEKSDLIARIVTQKNLGNLPMELSIHKLYQILGKIEDVDLRNAEFRAIRLIFREGSNDFCSFLFSLTQNLICIQILNLDPECQALERKAFADKKLFLDTNVLIGLVCPTDWQHKPATHLLTLSSSLGAKIFVTKKTCEEYLSILEDANRVFEKWNSPMKFLENTDNEFLVSFWLEKQNSESLSWNGFYQRNRDIGKILNERRIELYIEKMDNIQNNKYFKDIMAQVDLCYLSVKGRSKVGVVCEHDALLMLLMRELRREHKTSMLGPNYWFITGDESLLCVDNRINSIPDFPDKTPSSMLSDVWLEMISPFLPLSIREKDAYEAFSLLVKHQFALVPFQINAEKLVKIQGSWTQYEWLEGQDIVRIQNQEWTKQYLKRLESAKTQKDKAKVEEMGRLFSSKLEEELKKIHDDKLAQLMVEKKTLADREALLSTTLSTALEEKAKEIENREKIIESQKKDIEQKKGVIELKDRELEKENHFKRQLRTVATIAGLFLIISPLMMMILRTLPLVLEVVAYYTVSLFVGAILLYFGIAPERANVTVEARVNVSNPKQN